MLIIQLFRDIILLFHIPTQETSCEISSHRKAEVALSFSWSCAENSLFCGAFDVWKDFLTSI